MTHTPASHLAVAALALALAGCSSTGQQVGQAATTPLRDLNLVNAPIPELLQATQKAPYAMPGDRSCPALAAAVAELDAVLGPDLDAPKGDKPSLGDRGQAEAGKRFEVAFEVRQAAAHGGDIDRDDTIYRAQASARARRVS